MNLNFDPLGHTVKNDVVKLTGTDLEELKTNDTYQHFHHLGLFIQRMR